MELLHDITRCPLIQAWFASPQNPNPCAKIIAFQHAVHPENLDQHQVPEPWSGNIQQAPILFLSSNPSIDEKEEYPLWSWSDQWIEDFFINRFSGGRKQWIEDGIRNIKRDDTRKLVRFWIEVRQRAIELLERDVQPGSDYALTEVVHCKSRKEIGVAEALPECAKRYLQHVVTLSQARVIVVLGKTIRATVKREFKVPESEQVFGPVLIGRCQRHIAFLPHPNARCPRSFKKCIERENLEELRNFLRS